MENSLKYFTIFAILIGLIVVTQVALYIWVVVWIYKVSKDKTCACAKNWRRLYIIIFPIISFLMAILFSVIPKSHRYITNWLQFPVSIGWILFIVFAVQYINRLKRMNCECAIKKKSGDNALMAMSVIQIVMFVLGLLAIIGMTVYFFNSDLDTLYLNIFGIHGNALRNKNGHIKFKFGPLQIHNTVRHGKASISKN